MTLGAEVPPSQDDVKKALDDSRNAVQLLETKTQELNPNDAGSLHVTPILTLGWLILGWASLESHDLPTAENYLRAAWHLSQDRMSGYLLGCALEAKGDKHGAIHAYELASASKIIDPLGGFAIDRFPVDTKLEQSYHKLANEELADAMRSKYGKYADGLRAEMDKDRIVRKIIPSSQMRSRCLLLQAAQPRVSQSIWLTSAATSRG